MKVLYIQPKTKPQVIDITGSLESLQGLVGGHIEAIYPWSDKVALVCNEDGKFDSSCIPNRALIVDGQIWDLIFGSFFICGVGLEDFVDITEDQAIKYGLMFSERRTFPGPYTAPWYDTENPPWID